MIKTTTQPYYDTDSPTIQTTTEYIPEITEPPKPPNIENLNLMLDPSKKEERKEKVLEAKEKYNEEFGKVDYETAYTNLFEILWYSQLPCFDIRNITSESKDEMSMIKRCYWKGHPMSCSSIFLTRPTDRGMCCAFNMEKAEDIFRESKYSSALSKFQKQDQDLGFEDSALPKWYENAGEPKSQPGQNKGLTLILDAHTDRISPGTVHDNFRGFSTVVDGGERYPLTQRNSLLIRPGRENYIAISALSIVADDDIVDINPKKRYCYFPHEYPLEMHKNYSQSNCILECSMKYARSMMQSNETNECNYHLESKKNNETSNEGCESNKGCETKENKGCAPWFYPTSDDYYANVCDPWDTKVFQCYLSNVPDNTCTDVCLPDCTTTIYEASVSAAPFRDCDHTNIGLSRFCDLENNDMNPPMWAQMVRDEFLEENETVPEFAESSKDKLSPIRDASVNPDLIKDLTLKHHFLKNPTYNAFEKDIAVANFYFDQSNVRQFQRSHSMGWVGYMSQMGGLLGLGLGFSFISGMEILYWLVIKLCRNLVASYNYHRPNKLY